MDTYVSVASALYVRAARTRLLHAVRTGGTGQLVPHGTYTVRIRLGRAVRTAHRGTTGFELDERGVVLSVTGPDAPFSVTPPFRTSPKAERRGGGGRGDGSLLTGDRILAVNGVAVAGRAAVLAALPSSQQRAFVHFDVARADGARLPPPRSDGVPCNEGCNRMQ